MTELQTSTSPGVTPEVASTAPEPTASGGPEAHWRPVVRFVLAVVIAAVLCRLLWTKVPNQLSVTTDIVGNQIFSNFDIFRYTYGFYVIALLFPALAIGLYVLLAWRGPLRRLAWPPGRLLPLVTVGVTAAEPDVEPRPGAVASPARPADEDTAAEASLLRWFWAATRILLPALAVLVETAAGQTPLQGGLSTQAYLLALAYVVAVVGAAGLSARRPRGRHAAHERLSEAWLGQLARWNSLAAIVVVPLLSLVSANTSVLITSQHRVVHYQWFPWWAALALSIVALTVRWRYARAHPGLDGMRRLEAGLLVWVVGPILLFLGIAYMQGALPRYIGFDDAGWLVGTQLIFGHGLFPWRDIYLLHGLLFDSFDGGIGMAVFGNSRWGADVGITMFVTPLSWLSLYAFVAYFCRRNRLLLVGLVVLMTIGVFSTGIPRFLLVPVYLILFDRVLRRPSWLWCSLFSFVLIAGALLTPESLLFVACLYALVVVVDVTTRRPRTGLVVSFARTLRCAATGAVLTAAWTIFLWANGALSAFINYFVDFVPGHNLEGGFPAGWNLARDLMVTFEYGAPTVLWLATIWRVVAKIRLRRRWTPRDWVLVAAALLAITYVPKALDRLEPAHVYESFWVTMPLLLLWAMEVLEPADRLARAFARRVIGVRVPLRHLASGAAVVAIIGWSLASPVTVTAAVRSAPQHFHTASPDPAPPTQPRLGYSLPGATDIGQIDALGAILRRYAGADAPVFDFSNEPGITYYLLNRVPGTRFIDSDLAQTAEAQAQVIDDLKKSRPPVVVFFNTTFGIPNYDGVPDSLRSFAVSQFLFANYTPFVDVGGQLLLLRNDLRRSAPPLPTLPPNSLTSDLYFAGVPCNFGDIPNFFAQPADLDRRPQLRVPTESLERINRTISGWAVDYVSGAAATQVLAVVGDRVVASAPTGLARLDVAAARHDQAAATSGFGIGIPTEVSGPVALYAENTDGTVTPLAAPPTLAHSVVTGHAASVVTTDGVVHRVAGSSSAVGSIDGVSRGDAEVLRLELPAGTQLSDYPWIRLQAPRAFNTASFAISDTLASVPAHEIQFKSLPRAGNQLTVGVGSCLQWHGYDPEADLYLSGSSRSLPPISVSLIG